MKSIREMLEKLEMEIRKKKGKRAPPPSPPPPDVPTQRSFELFVELMSTYPIARSIANNLTKAELLKVPQGIPALQGVFFTPLTNRVETIQDLLARSGSIKTTRQAGFRALTEAVAQFVLNIRAEKVEVGRYDFTDVFGYSSNFRKAPELRSSRLAVDFDEGEDGRSLHYTFDDFVPMKPAWGSSARRYAFHGMNTPDVPRYSTSFPVNAKKLDHLLMRSQRLERTLLVLRLKAFRRELSPDGSEDPSEERDAFFHNFPRKLGRGPHPKPECNCKNKTTKGCACPGFFLGSVELDGLWKPQFFEAVYNKEYCIPLPVTKDQLDKLIVDLEKRNSIPELGWRIEDKLVVRGILAYRAAIRSAELPSAPASDCYWQTLVKGCVECESCGRTAEELEVMYNRYAEKWDRTCPQRLGTSQCWGCKGLICYECTIHTYLRLPHYPASHFFFQPTIYRQHFQLGMRRSRRLFLPCLVFYAAHLTSSEGWGAHILSCVACFKTLPRTGIPPSHPLPPHKVYLPIHYNSDPVEHFERIALRKVSVLWAWCHPAGKLQGIDKRGECKVAGSPIVGRKAQVMGEVTGWTWRKAIGDVGPRCVWFTPDYRYHYT